MKGDEKQDRKRRLQESDQGTVTGTLPRDIIRTGLTPCVCGWGDPALPLGIVCLLKDGYIHIWLENAPGQAWLAVQHVLATILSVFSPQEKQLCLE